MMKVLIADDEPAIRYSLKRLFERFEFTVFLASDGEEALELWRSESPNLIFLDVIMPKKTGLEVLDKIRESDQTKVILMSAHTGGKNTQGVPEIFDGQSLASADAFLSKPFQNIFDLKRLVDRLFVNSESESGRENF